MMPKREETMENMPTLLEFFVSVITIAAIFGFCYLIT